MKTQITSIYTDPKKGCDTYLCLVSFNLYTSNSLIFICYGPTASSSVSPIFSERICWKCCTTPSSGGLWPLIPRPLQMYRLSQKCGKRHFHSKASTYWISEKSIVRFSFSKNSPICVTANFPLIGPTWSNNYTAPVLYRNNRPARLQRNRVKTAP